MVNMSKKRSFLFIMLLFLSSWEQAISDVASRCRHQKKVLCFQTQYAWRSGLPGCRSACSLLQALEEPPTPQEGHFSDPHFSLHSDGFIHFSAISVLGRTWPCFRWFSLEALPYKEKPWRFPWNGHGTLKRGAPYKQTGQTGTVIVIVRSQSFLLSNVSDCCCSPL